MSSFERITLAAVLSIAAVAASASFAEAANVVPYGGVGQHATVMNNIARAQQRNNAAISHVPNNIRAGRHRSY